MRDRLRPDALDVLFGVGLVAVAARAVLVVGWVMSMLVAAFT